MYSKAHDQPRDGVQSVALANIGTRERTGV
jgi:hypothetical protein